MFIGRTAHGGNVNIDTGNSSSVYASDNYLISGNHKDNYNNNK